MLYYTVNYAMQNMLCTASRANLTKQEFSITHNKSVLHVDTFYNIERNKHETVCVGFVMVRFIFFNVVHANWWVRLAI